jgi:hypothetical protein
MKPWQASSNKAPSQGGKEEQRERTQVQARSTTTESESQMRQRNNLCSKAPHQSQEAYQGRKGKLKDLIMWLHGKLSRLLPTVSPKRQRSEKRNQGKTKIPFRKKEGEFSFDFTRKRKRKNVSESERKKQELKK